VTVTDSTDDDLDSLLGVWARQQRLDQRQADDILRAITGQPHPTLPVTWWTDLSTQLTAAVVLATSHPSAPVVVLDTELADAAA
jgi:hypothetical protein